MLNSKIHGGIETKNKLLACFTPITLDPILELLILATQFTTDDVPSSPITPISGNLGDELNALLGSSPDGGEISHRDNIIGVQDQTYRHSWPNSEVVVSFMEGGRNETEHVMRDAVFQFKDLECSSTIAEGFFGRVYIATNKRNQDKVIVKELKESDHDAQIAFIHEVALLKAIDHPNLLMFLGLFVATSTDTTESLNMVTEYVSGGTLEDAVKGEKEHFKELTWEMRISWAYELADGLAYLHQKRMIHRDIKPANCLIRAAPDFSLVLCDFGLARVMEGEVLRDDVKETKQLGGQAHVSTPKAPANLAPPAPLLPGDHMSPRQHSRFATRAMTVRGEALTTEVNFRARRMSIVGTVDYMAPELAMNMEYNEAVDIFSFAIVLACALIARKEADPDEDRGADFGLDGPKFKAAHGAGVPPGLLSLACETGSADPSKRPAFPKVMAKLRMVRLKLPMELEAAAKAETQAASSRSQEIAVVALKPKKQEFIEKLIEDYGEEIQSNIVTKAQIEETMAKHELKLPRWFIQDPDYQVGDNFRVPQIRAPPPKVTEVQLVVLKPKKQVFIEKMIEDYGEDIQENLVTRSQIDETMEKHGLSLPRWFIQDPDYQVGNEFRVPRIKAPSRTGADKKSTANDSEFTSERLDNNNGVDEITPSEDVFVNLPTVTVVEGVSPDVDPVSITSNTELVEISDGTNTSRKVSSSSIDAT